MRGRDAGARAPLTHLYVRGWGRGAGQSRVCDDGPCSLSLSPSPASLVRWEGRAHPPMQYPRRKARRARTGTQVALHDGPADKRPRGRQHLAMDINSEEGEGRKIPAHDHQGLHAHTHARTPWPVYCEGVRCIDHAPGTPRRISMQIYIYIYISLPRD